MKRRFAGAGRRSTCSRSASSTAPVSVPTGEPRHARSRRRDAHHGAERDEASRPRSAGGQARTWSAAAASAGGERRRRRSLDGARRSAGGRRRRRGTGARAAAPARRRPPLPQVHEGVRTRDRDEVPRSAPAYRRRLRLPAASGAVNDASCSRSRSAGAWSGRGGGRLDRRRPDLRSRPPRPFEQRPHEQLEGHERRRRIARQAEDDARTEREEQHRLARLDRDLIEPEAAAETGDDLAREVEVPHRRAARCTRSDVGAARRRGRRAARARRDAPWVVADRRLEQRPAAGRGDLHSEREAVAVADLPAARHDVGTDELVAGREDRDARPAPARRPGDGRASRAARCAPRVTRTTRPRARVAALASLARAVDVLARLRRTGEADGRTARIDLGGSSIGTTASAASAEPARRS